MKKTVFLILTVAAVLILDGSLTYDLFDSEGRTLFGWFLFLLGVVMGGIILISDATQHPAHPPAPPPPAPHPPHRPDRSPPPDRPDRP